MCGEKGPGHECYIMMLTIAIVPSVASEASVTLTDVAANGVVAGGIFSTVNIVTFVYICDHVYNWL